MKGRSTLIFFIFCILLFPAALFAQDIKVSGKVTDQTDGGPLPGVTVSLEGTTRATSAINLSPLTPVTVSDLNTITDPAQRLLYNNPAAVRAPNGSYYGIPGLGFQEMTNPLAYIQNNLGNYNWSHDIVGNAYVEASPIPGLKLRSTIGTKMSFYGNDAFTPVAYYSTSSSNATSTFYRAINYTLAYTQENTATYTKSFGKNNFNFLLGEGYYRDNYSRGVNTTFYNIPATDFGSASFNYKPTAADRTSDASDGTDHIVNSLFSRVQYDYDEKYLFTALVRRDGSSRFGANHKFGYFPSFSAGWVPTREDFIPKNDVLNFMKIRASYGITGNDVIGDFSYVPLVASGSNYPFGSGSSQLINVGYSPATAANPDLKWEQTAQTDIGIDATFFQNLTFTADWYRKKTTGILQNPPTPAYVGYLSSAENAADMQNTGIEFEVGYHKKVGDFNLGINANASFLKNKVTKLLPGVDYIEDNTAAFQTLGNITRTAVGGAYNEFYGYKNLGIFQSQAEINAYRGPSGALLQPNAKPGDIKFANLNGDNTIDASDRTYIGNPTPKMTYGITINVGYKNFDLVAFGSGVAGNQIFQGLRRLDIPSANYQTDILNAWTPTNTNTSIPRLVANDPNGNYTKFSSVYLQSGNYFRLRTLQVGYTFPKAITDKMKMQKLRIYIMSENLFTITKYNGYDPELGVSNDAGGGGVFSVDRGAYPQARSFLIGLNVGF
ncbi:SusC/RagA family TonB-linked outer membrane protein [Pedobacter sp. L105]|uniref:SusC/RagA family TonB-linked outer membrane protein n=1 Tax=Pedobacter sp. L105 TaxID=1641871 RepID=UPI00131E2D59|nr:SusC/RagA family TonB-linked outer membrane protein [Pedobacter sp. L105]